MNCEASKQPAEDFGAGADNVLLALCTSTSATLSMRLSFLDLFYIIVNTPFGINLSLFAKKIPSSFR